MECTGTIRNLEPEDPRTVNNYLQAQGFPWGFDLTSCRSKSEALRLAVVHKYCWHLDAFEPGLNKKESNAPAFQKKLKGFDAIVTGDNHRSFIVGNLCNPGSFFRRTLKERFHKPMVGLLTNSGKIYPYYFDCSQDKFVDELDPYAIISEFGDFVKELEKLEDLGLDFPAAVKQAITAANTNKQTQQIILNAIEHAMQKGDK